MPSAPLMPAVAPVAVPPTVRVRVIDRHTQKSLDDVAVVVFVPADDHAPIVVPLAGGAAQITTDKDAKLAALQTLPARKFLVRATAPGYAQTTYCDGPISLYYEHVVVDAEGTPQKEVVVEMERRCVCVWLSCRDARTGDMLPTAKVRLRDTRGTGAAFVFDKPGEHTVDVGRPDALGDDAVYAVEVELSGYLLWGPKTVTLTHGAVVELHVDLRATDVRVDCRDLRTMQALDDVFVTLVAGDELDARNDVLFLGVGPRRVAAVDLEKPYRIEATAPNMRQGAATARSRRAAACARCRRTRRRS